MQPNDKGAGTVYNRDIDAAWRALSKAAPLIRTGDLAGAKPLAEEVMKRLEGCF